MAFSMVRIASRLTTMNALDRYPVASAQLAANLSFKDRTQLYENSFSTSSQLSSSKKSFVEQAREFSKRPEGATQRAYNSDSDSESDRETRGKEKKRGETEFWRRKMRTLHGVLDVDNNSVISFDDFIILADKFGKLGHLTPKELEEFRSVMRSFWEKQWGEISPYNLVTTEQYLADMYHVVNDKYLRKKCHKFLPYLFKAIDKNHSGEISIKEYKLFFRCLGLSEEDAAISFAVIDTNGDGKLSMKEFVKLGRDFFLNEDESCASRMFWGQLITH